MLDSGAGQHKQPVFTADAVAEIDVLQVSGSLKPFVILKRLGDLTAPHRYASREPIHLNVPRHGADHALITGSKHRATSKPIHIEERFHQNSARRTLVHDVKSSPADIVGSGLPKRQHGLDASILQYKVIVKITR